jgi:hypothetical protein
MTLTELKSHAAAGLSIRAAARLVGSSPETVVKIADRFGVVFKRREAWQRVIEQEFGESAHDVITGFARMGYSKILTAGAIGITTQTLLNYTRREGIVFADRKNLRDECKPKPRKKGIVRNPWGRRGKDNHITV